ncbi:hypothetical protein EAF04_000697 [Stromatinia cepivora]|nr:hypothetical protein EAF04_000697 [Stromatinia cepivora]
MEAKTMAAKLKIRKAKPMGGKSMEIEVGEILNKYKPNTEFALNEEKLKIVEGTTEYKTALTEFYISLDDYKKDIWEYNKEVSSFNEERKEYQSIYDMVASLQDKILKQNERARNLANWVKRLEIAEEDLKRKARKRIHLLILASAS